MNKKSAVFALISCLLIAQSQVVFACSEDGSTGIAPENNLYIPVGAMNALSLSEAQFNGVIDKVSKIYAPMAQAAGATLTVERRWDDGTVNAFASRSGHTWTVHMYGGLARSSVVTEDAFTLVMCHELGHHFGVDPRKPEFFFLHSWATDEGQADYYGNLKCMRKVFANDDNASIINTMDIPATVVSTCQKQFSSSNDVAICERSSMAGMSLATLLSSLGGSKNAPNFETPDTHHVAHTDPNHPQAQCRLDTYFAGAACHKSVSEEISPTDPNAGVCTLAEGDTVGYRPLCWFAPPKSGT